MHRLLLFLLVLTMAVGIIMAQNYEPACNTPCRTGGHVPTCCRSHGYRGGWCNGARFAVCYN
ncbi:hypothetical protein I4U23_027728 [Adineta vaga]|nr:hypothetical protein I4U23_027728 [Adineta vaga]